LAHSQLILFLVNFIILILCFLQLFTVIFGHLRHLSTVTVWPLAANIPRHYDDSFETTLSGSAFKIFVPATGNGYR